MIPGKFVIKGGKYFFGKEVKGILKDMGNLESVTVTESTSKWQNAYVVYYWTINGKPAKPDDKPRGFVAFGELEFGQKDFDSNKELQKWIEENKKTFLGYDLDK